MLHVANFHSRTEGAVPWLASRNVLTVRVKGATG